SSKSVRRRAVVETSRKPTPSASSSTTAASSWKTPPPARAGNANNPMTAPEIKTPLPGPNARKLIERDAKYVSPSYTRGYPLVIARGEGAVVEDVDGNRFLDCAAGIAVNSTGHSHPDVVRAIVD